MSSTKRTLTLVLLALGYLTALLIGQRHADRSPSEIAVLPIDGVNGTCQVENHYVGDGQIRGRQTCSPPDTEAPRRGSN
ncbi:hypothetical protein [Burkholderia cenocepacia]|uniref:Exported protein n=1 Tax=Burkholderia cenocepacia (strain ATCC BAA-245 / DSM 16553 / LMG 16656 / NCTC 13227 / J2315 / CF5610) TaxID=216591 RepID=B4EQJ1_BURCJ|nr:hypothetical protein [Burkholderia cenocepacia]KIS46037.1 putative exported protein [Burkholderia cepacia]ONR58990.1 hypothetical protein A8E17_15550 [Burkholderia cenocepacia]ONR67521.1 hypothetical protein A8E18_24105 [Burkholderia cenocepacia]ONR68490.1 hypothetical protein A8E23_19605 [Burkholderia cenocepacia]ONR82565.1 hypothetical protein A8E25_32395 [Burkholderia cenocepacia]